MIRARDNPFSTDRVLTVRYRPIDWTWNDLLDRLSHLDYRCAIVGPQGSGKTTLLEDLEAKLTAGGFVVRWLSLNREQRSIPQSLFKSISPGDVILFDGCEQIGPIAWRWFRFRTRRAGGLIITTHLPGRLPTLVACKTTPELLHGIVFDLSATEKIETNALFTRHHGNVREALRELYDQHANSPV